MCHCGDGGGRSFAFTLIPRTGVERHTYSLHRTHMGCLTWTVKTHVLLWAAGMTEPKDERSQNEGENQPQNSPSAIQVTIPKSWLMGKTSVRKIPLWQLGWPGVGSTE